MSIRYAYIATPYTHADPRKREERHDASVVVSALLLRLGLRLFNPIGHTHLMDTKLREWGVDISHAEWLEQDKPFAINADVLIVLMVPGWQESAGVSREIAFFSKMKRPILYLDMDDFHLMQEQEDAERYPGA